MKEVVDLLCSATLARIRGRRRIRPALETVVGEDCR
jgi:hypothetical protein